MSDNETRKWANVSGCAQQPYEGDSVKGARRHIPPEKIRQWAHESTDGGTARCYKCGLRFAMYYIVLVQVDFMHQQHACKDCRKKYQLQIVK